MVECFLLPLDPVDVCMMADQSGHVLQRMRKENDNVGSIAERQHLLTSPVGTIANRVPWVEASYASLQHMSHVC